MNQMSQTIQLRLRPSPEIRSLVFAAWVAFAALLGLVLATPAGAQTPEAPAPEAQSEEPEAQSEEEVQPEPVTFAEQLEVRVVNVDVFVSDRSGDPVPGLTEEEFELRVDGEPMPISNFYREIRSMPREVVRTAERPREAVEESEFTPVEEVQATGHRRNYVVVLIDHTRLRTANRKRAFKALKRAVAELDPEDLIAVVGVEESLVFYSDFLYDRQAIGEILDRASSVSMTSDIGEAERRQIIGELTRGQSGGLLARTALADEGQLLARIQSYAATEYARSLTSFRQIESVLATLNGIPGRKILLYLGEGIPTRPGEGLFVELRNRFSGPELGMRHYNFNTDYERAVGRYDLTDQMEQLAEAAHRADAILFAVDAEGNHGMEMRSALTEQGSTSESVSVIDENFRAPLEYTTQATGGRLLRSSGQLDEQIADLFLDFDNVYSLGFEMPPSWQPGSTHRIDVKVTGGRFRVRHRNEVRVPRPNEREAGATVAALLYQTVDNPLGIQADPESPTRQDDGTTVLPVRLGIPVDSLELIPRGDSHSLSVSIYISIKDRDGNPRPVQRVPFHLDIPSDKVEEAAGQLAHYTLPVVLRSGDQQVAITVRDDVDRSLSTVRLDVGEHTRDI